MLWTHKEHPIRSTRVVRGAPFLSLQFGELEMTVDGSGPGCVLWLRLSSPAFSVRSSPAPPPSHGREGESALQSKMGAASGQPRAAGAGWTRVLWSERCCALAWSLPVLLYPVSPSSLARYPQLLLKADEVCSSESPPLPWYVASVS